jgi:hypothetical protein
MMNASFFACHPEPAKTARDLANSASVTQIYECDRQREGEVPQRLRCFGMTQLFLCLRTVRAQDTDFQ